MLQDNDKATPHIYEKKEEEGEEETREKEAARSKREINAVDTHTHDFTLGSADEKKKAFKNLSFFFLSSVSTRRC